MRFGNPLVFWLLLLLPGFYFLLRLGRQRRDDFLRRFGDPAVLRQTPARFQTLRATWLATALLMLLFLSTIIALADPRLPTGASYLRAGTLDVAMLLDVSKSMAAEDYGLRSRLDQARQRARDFISDLQGNRVGLVTFAGTSFRQADLTEDLDALDFILQSWVTVDAVGVKGSNIARAIATGLELLPEGSSRQQLMLLFSDGGDGEALPHAVLHDARRRGIPIVAFGLGRLTPSRIPLYDTNATFKGYLRAEGQLVTTRLQEAPLQQIAAATGGTYLRLDRGDEGRDLLARKSVVGKKTLARQETRLFQLFLGIGLGAFGAYTLIARL